MTKPAPLAPAAVLEHDDAFLKLWPHRYDYIYAKHPPLGQKPDWKTESRHPLSDRLIHQGSYLYGVRFGPTTHYLMLDIDSGSPYHPAQNPPALARIKDALEPLGLIDYLICNSSDSGGLHLYFPFSEPQPSWQIALAAATLLENQGLVLAPGTLEVFPHPKAYSHDAPSLYHGHRLPLQGLSFLLDDNLEPRFSDRRSFAAGWHHVQRRNDINSDTLQQVLRCAHRRNYRVSGKAEKFLNDLNADIEPGWTGSCQTNDLLGRITMRTYIFGHILGAAKPLEGEDLVAEIIRVARSLPGFEEWCNHKHDLEKRARDWARAIENSHYYHYGTKPTAKDPSADPSWNQQQALGARERIRVAIASLLEDENLPAGISDRFNILTRKFQISGQTLYRHLDLWHPQHLADAPPDPPDSEKKASGEVALEGHLPNSPSNLLGGDGCKTPLERVLSGIEPQQTEATGRNTLLEAGLSDAGQATDEETAQYVRTVQLSIHARLEQIRQNQTRAAEQARLNREEAERQRQAQAQAEHQERIEAWLNSGDPVLMKEAILMMGNPSPEAMGKP